MNPPSDRTPTVTTIVTRTGVATRRPAVRRPPAAFVRLPYVPTCTSALPHRPLPDTPAPAGTCLTERTHR